MRDPIKACPQHARFGRGKIAEYSAEGLCVPRREGQDEILGTTPGVIFCGGVNGNLAPALRRSPDVGWTPSSSYLFAGDDLQQAEPPSATSQVADRRS